MNDPNDLDSILFPRDEREHPAAVLYAQIGNDRETAGKFKPVQVDPETGALIVHVAGNAGTGGLFVNENGQSTSVVVDSKNGAMYVELVASDAVIGRVITEIRTPNFVLMHDRITSANQSTVAPTSIPPNSYNATGCQKILIHIDVSPGGSLKLRPATWNPIFQKYVYGDPTPYAITEPFELELDVWGVENVYLIPIEVSGTVSVSVAGV